MKITNNNSHKIYLLYDIKNLPSSLYKEDQIFYAELYLLWVLAPQPVCDYLNKLTNQSRATPLTPYFRILFNKIARFTQSDVFQISQKRLQTASYLFTADRTVSPSSTIANSIKKYD